MPCFTAGEKFCGKMKKGVDRGREKQYTNQAVPREGLKNSRKNGLKKPVNPRERYGENSPHSIADTADTKPKKLYWQMKKVLDK